MAIPLVSAALPDTDAMEAPPFCQCCQVACHRFRPAKPCSVSVFSKAVSSSIKLFLFIEKISFFMITVVVIWDMATVLPRAGVSILLMW